MPRRGRSIGTAVDSLSTPSASPPISRTPSAYPPASVPWRRRHWSARWVRPSGCTTSGRRNRDQTTAIGEQSVTTNPSRRDVLTSSIALAATVAIPSLAHVSPALAASSIMSAAEIVAAIRAEQSTADDLANAAFARAEQVRELNALIIINKDPGLAAAAQNDAWSRPGPLPLAGLPIVVKDNINTADMPTSAGTPALQNAQPSANAPSLQKLLNAGVIMIGKSNMHELA